MPACKNVKGLLGLKFGRLSVIARAGSDKKRQALWLCKCNCGAETTVLGTNLRNGNTSSCGCFHKEVVSLMSTTHGCSKSRLYGIWAGMHSRCNNPNDTAYKFYGARGATVCPEWGDFEVFRRWAMLAGYSDLLEIDKDILHPGNMAYSPDRCLFVAPKINGLIKPNRCSTHKYPRGVNTTSSGKFRAYGSLNGKQAYIGLYNTVDEAEAAYLTFKIGLISDVMAEPDNLFLLYIGLHRHRELLTNRLQELTL